MGREDAAWGHTRKCELKWLEGVQGAGRIAARESVIVRLGEIGAES